MRLSRATLYGAQVFLSFFLMLVFMTYNVSPVSRLAVLSPRPPSGPLVSSVLSDCSPAFGRSSAYSQAYLIAAVVVGAALGNYLFNPSIDVDAVLAGGASGKGMACH